MTFGYLGYIWAILACGLFSLIFLGSAAFLYGLSRRRRAREAEPTHVVESVPLPGSPRPGGATDPGARGGRS